MPHDALLHQVREAVRAGDLPAAIQHLKQAAEAPGASAAVFLQLADLLWINFQFPEALKAFDQAAAKNPQDPLPSLLAARKLFSLGRFASAAEHLRRVMALKPDQGDTHRMLAEVLDRQGLRDEALTQARMAVERQPEDARAIRALAHILRNAGKLPEAIELLQRHAAEHRSSETWRVNQELAACLDRVGEYEAAMTALLDAKSEQRSVSPPLLVQWRQRAQRREDFAALLTKETLQEWHDQSQRLEPRWNIAILAGHPRSGTTLLEQRLGAHSSVVTTDETGILRTQFVEPIVLEGESATSAFSEVAGFDLEQLSAGREVYRRATEAHLGQSFEGKLLIEKDPLATWDLGFLVRLIPESRVIFPLRDPRDVCISFFFTLVPLNADSAPSADLASTCEAAALSLRLWSHWKRVLPQPWVEVRYERLVQDPRTELAAVARTLDLPWDEGLIAPRADHGSRGVRTPTYADVAQPLYTRAIGRWKHYERWLVPAMGPLIPLLKEYGYEP